MSVKRLILEVGFDKNGQPDFGVVADVQSLPPDKMNDLRSMTIAAIGTMEDMWRRGQEKQQLPGSRQREDGDGGG